LVVFGWKRMEMGGLGYLYGGGPGYGDVQLGSGASEYVDASMGDGA
jgi:hypothetical protein